MADSKPMDPRLDRLQTMGLSHALRNMQLTDRLGYDAASPAFSRASQRSNAVSNSCSTALKRAVSAAARSPFRV